MNEKEYEELNLQMRRALETMYLQAYRISNKTIKVYSHCKDESLKEAHLDSQQLMKFIRKTKGKLENGVWSKF